MLFQCEKGKHTDHVRIRSKATNTLLFFRGIKQPLTWVVRKRLHSPPLIGWMLRRFRCLQIFQITFIDVEEESNLA